MEATVTEHRLYRGHWPKNVSKTAKYGVRIDNGEWEVTVVCDLGDGLKYLAVDRGTTNIAKCVNQIKQAVARQEGGAFYINEYQHLLVPLKRGNDTHYFSDGKVDCEFHFEFEGKRLTSKPVNADGNPLSPGDEWIGPRPGIPYVLAAGGKDIYYETPALTETDPPEVRENLTRKVELSKVIKDNARLASAIQPILDVRKHQGGRFYVNEHGAIFTPVDKGDGNGLNYIYCGQIDFDAWFPEPVADNSIQEE